VFPPQAQVRHRRRARADHQDLSPYRSPAAGQLPRCATRSTAAPRRSCPEPYPGIRGRQRSEPQTPRSASPRPVRVWASIGSPWKSSGRPDPKRSERLPASPWRAAETTVRWLAPALSLTHAGPSLSILNGEVNYDTTVTNIGQGLNPRSMTVSSAVPNGYQYLRFESARVCRWQQSGLGVAALAGGQLAQGAGDFPGATKQGDVPKLSPAVLFRGGLRTEKCVDTNRFHGPRSMGINGPQAVAVGGMSIPDHGQQSRRRSARQRGAQRHLLRRLGACAGCTRLT